MSLFKGSLNAANLFTAQDDVRGLSIIKYGTAPSYLGLEAGDGVNWYLWWDNSDNLRKHTSAPTAATQASVGSVVFGASNAGASTNLSNCTSVAFPVDFSSDTDSTDDLGSSSAYWAETYTDKLYFNSTATMEGTTTAGVVTLVGNIIGGATGTGSSFKFWATTAGGYIHWDDTAAGNDGGLIFTDSASLLFGDESDFIVEWDGSNLTMDCKADNTGVIAIGGTKDTDVLFNGATASSDMLWDASADALHIYDDVVVAYGDEQDFTMKWNATSMLLDNKTANTGNLVIGSAVATDVELHGTTYDLIWDSSADDLTFADGTELQLGTNNDLSMAFAHPLTTWTLGDTDTGIVLVPYADATVAALDIDGNANGWDGADNVGLLNIKNDTALIHAGASLLHIQNTGKPINSASGFVATFSDVSTNVDTDPAYAVAIESAANFGLHITTAAAAVSNLVLAGLQAQTSSMMVIDGTTGTGWDGADDVGMLEINTLIQNHTGATCLLIETEVAPITAAEGACARFIQSGGAAVTDGYLVQIEATTLGGALHVDTGFVTFDEALTVGGTLTQTGAATFTAGSQNAAVTIAPNAGGDGTAIIAAGTSFCSVTSTNTAHILTLPVPVLGNAIILETTDTVHFELGVQATTQYINGTLCNGGETLEVVDTATFMAVCTLGGASGKWIITSITSAGVVTNGATPD